MNCFLYKNDEIGFIDLDYIEKIYRNGNLEGATVFSKLFNLCNDNDMDYSMKKNNKNQYTIFKDLDISIKEWSYIMIFLKTNSIIHTGNEISYIRLLESIHMAINKLGGFPSFDKYLTSEFSKITEIQNKNIYNPMTPEEDYLQKYQWKVVTIGTNNIELYSFTIPVPNSSLNTFYYARKSK